MAGQQQQPASVPLEPLPLPQHVYKDGVRLDGRGNEEFRNICESLAIIYVQPAASTVLAGNTRPWAETHRSATTLYLTHLTWILLQFWTQG